MAFRNTQKRQRVIADLQKARRLFSQNERRLTQDVRAEGLQRTQLERMGKKQIANLSTKDIERMAKSYARETKKMQKAKGANVTLTNQYGVVMTAKTARDYKAEIDAHNDQVTKNREKFDKALRKGANVPEGVPTPEQVYYGHSELEYKKSYLNEYQNQRNFDRSMDKMKNTEKTDKLQQYFDNYKKAFIEQLNPEEEQVEEFNKHMDRLGVDGFNERYYANEDAFYMDFIYEEHQTGNKIEMILGSLRDK